MSKQKRTGNEMFSLKTGIFDARSPKAKRKKTSVFDADNCTFDASGEPNDFDKLWKGEPSGLDGIDLEECYEVAVENKKRQRASPQKKSAFDDSSFGNGGEEEEIPLSGGNDLGFESSAGLNDDNDFDKLWKGEPSGLDVFEPSEEYYKAAAANEQKQRASPEKISIFGDGDNIARTEEHVREHRPLVIHGEARAIQGEDMKDDASEDEVEYLALQIAEDLARKESIRIIGGALYIFNGKFYTLLSEESVYRAILANYRKEVGKKNTVSIIKNAATLLRFCVQKEHEEFPINLNLIIFENGTLEVDTGNFRNNSPKDLACSALGIHYVPRPCKMPYTKYFLETIADGDNDLFERMLQMIGYILSNDIRAKSFFYLEGVGDAGKSRFCDLIASFFPTSGANKVARIALQDLGGKFALANLVNAKLNISEDLPDSPLSPTTVSRIKMISDSNRLEAEAKYAQAFSFRPTCKLLFASNHPLRLKEYDAAFMNRVVYIPFMHAIPKHKQDKNILEKMQKELPALFNHAFAAYKRLVANGYVWAGADRFKPQIAIVGSGITINKEQSLRHFVEVCCEFQDDSITSTADLQETYEKFCRKRGYAPVMGDRFSRELAAVLPSGVTRIKIGNQRRGFKGLRLKKEYENDVF